MEAFLGVLAFALETEAALAFLGVVVLLFFVTLLDLATVDFFFFSSSFFAEVFFFAVDLIRLFFPINNPFEIICVFQMIRLLKQPTYNGSGCICKHFFSQVLICKHSSNPSGLPNEYMQW